MTNDPGYTHEQYVQDQLADVDALFARMGQWDDDRVVIRVEQGPESSALYVTGLTPEAVQRLIADALDAAGVARGPGGSSRMTPADATPDRGACGITRWPGLPVCDLRAGHAGPHAEPDARCPAHARPIEPPTPQRLAADRLGHDALPSYLFGFRGTGIEPTADAFGPGRFSGYDTCYPGCPACNRATAEPDWPDEARAEPAGLCGSDRDRHPAVIGPHVHWMGDRYEVCEYGAKCLTPSCHADLTWAD